MKPAIAVAVLALLFIAGCETVTKKYIVAPILDEVCDSTNNPNCPHDDCGHKSCEGDMP